MRFKYFCIDKHNYFLLAWLLATSAHADGYATPYGEWRGQAQYQAFINTTSDPAAHIVTDLIISIAAQGKFIGSSVENGCRLLGLAAPGVTPTLVTLDVTLTNCNYSDMNRTYRGLLSVNEKDRYATFSLQAVRIAPSKAGTFNITATMRR